jgi:hypothetical protein
MSGLDMRDWIGTGEAGRRLRMHPVNVLRLINLGELPAVLVAGRWLIDPAKVEELRRKREARPPRRGPRPKQPKPDGEPADLALVT